MENYANIEQLWDAARNQALILSAEELISQLPKQKSGNKAAKSAIIKAITGLVFTMLILLVFFWFNPKEKQKTFHEDIARSTPPQIQTITKQQASLKKTEQRLQPVFKQALSMQADTLQETPIEGSQIIELPHVPNLMDSPIVEFVEEPFALNFGFNSSVKSKINLTEEQLKKLGIIYDERTLIYCTHEVYDREKFKLMAEPPKFYMEIKRGGNTYVLLNKLGSRKKLAPYPEPVMVERRMINQEKSKKKYYRTDSLDISFLKGTYANEDISDALLSYCRSNLAVISLPVITKPLPPYGKTDYEVNFYYAITDSFLRCIPASAKKELQPFINNHPPDHVNELLGQLIEREGKRKEGQSLEDYLHESSTQRAESSTQVLATITPLIATQAFLDSMEIKVGEKGITVKHCEDKGSCFNSFYTKEGATFEFKLKRPNETVQPKPLSRVPEISLITDPTGKAWRTVALDTKQPADSLEKILANLIPVLVKSGQSYTANEEKKGLLHPDLLLWYPQTDFFLKKIPPGFLATGSYNGSCTYKEACLTKSLLVKEFRVYPNPIEEEIYVEFTLEKVSPVEVKLIGLGGQEIVNFGLNQSTKVGLNSAKFKAPLLSPGIYFLLLQTPSGDRQMKKLIKR